MRITILYLILCLVTLSPAKTLANNDLIGIDKGTILEYKIQYTSRWDNSTDDGDFEYYKFLNYDDQIKLPDLSNEIQNNVELRQFFKDNIQGIDLGYSNTTHLEVSEISINPYRPGSVIIIRDWQYFREFGEIYDFDPLIEYLDEKRAALAFFYLDDDGFNIEINMGSVELEFYGPPDNIYGIENYNEYYYIYDKSTGVLISFYHKFSKINCSRMTFSPTYDEIISIESETLLSKIYVRKFLYNYEEVLFPANEDNEKRIPIEKTIAYSLLVVVLTLSIYLERKKWNHRSYK